MDVTIQTIQEVYETIDVSVPLGLSHGAVGTWPRRYRREVTVRDGWATQGRVAMRVHRVRHREETLSGESTQRRSR